MNWFHRKKTNAAFVRDFLEANRKATPAASLISDLKFVVIDMETSGLNTHKDRILSVSTLCIDAMDLEVNSLREWLVYQTDAPMNQAVEIHGILPSETRHGRPEEVVLEELLPLLSNHVLVGHHVGFDIRMLSNSLRRYFGIKLPNPWVDTAHLAMQVLEAFHRTGYPGQRPPSLDDVCSQLNVTVVDRHTSAGDSFATAEIFLLLCARLKKQLGRPLKLKDLQD